MTNNELMPPDRLAFYNRYGNEIVSSAVEAISDSIHEHTGHVANLELRQTMTEIIAKAWVEYDRWIDPKPTAYIRDPDMAARDKAVGREIVLRATALISNSVSDAVGEDVVNTLGLPIAEEVARAFANLVESLINFNRDVIITLGADKEA